MPSRTGSYLEPKETDSLIRELYPFVDETKTPLPRCWSAKDKHAYLGLSQDGRTVHYKGSGKNHKDAASVRTTHAIPSTCGIYYFEIKIISKGRDGYMGIGFSRPGVSLNRLPGWDKHSFGYHGDDGCSFCSSGCGNPYGPTYTTGDVLGCGLHLVKRKCFFTKNGHMIGSVFNNLPARLARHIPVNYNEVIDEFAQNDLFPVVGLQTPGEVVEANFGQEPFLYDIEGELKETQARVNGSVGSITLSNPHHLMMSKLVLSYLSHHGFYNTVEGFSKLTGLPLSEDGESIRNRQKIKSAILAGRISEAVELIQSIYPGLLDENTDLLFMLKCRQFIEMVNRTEPEMNATARKFSARNSPTTSAVAPARTHHLGPYAKPRRSPFHSPSVPESPRQSPRQVRSPKPRSLTSSPGPSTSGTVIVSNNSNAPTIAANNSATPVVAAAGLSQVTTDPDPVHASNGYVSKSDGLLCDESMDCSTDGGPDLAQVNGVHSHVANGSNAHAFSGEDSNEQPEDENSLGELVPAKGWSTQDVEYYQRLLDFGRELLHFSQQLQIKHGPSSKNRQMLEKAYALLAYTNPANSPVSYQLDPSQREVIASAVNSAILLRLGSAPEAPMESLMKHGERLQQVMASHGMGACAFTHPRQALFADQD